METNLEERVTEAVDADRAKAAMWLVEKFVSHGLLDGRPEVVAANLLGLAEGICRGEHAK